MADEKIYVIPLRRDFLKAPNYKRSERAISTIREFLIRHTKAEQVKIGRYLNLEIWKHGRKNPPGKIKVKVLKQDNITKVELIDKPFEEVKKQPEEDKVKIKLPFTKKEEVKEEAKEETKMEKEKKEVLEHAKLTKKERKVKTFIDKSKPTQEQKRAGIIGGTGKK